MYRAGIFVFGVLLRESAVDYGTPNSLQRSSKRRADASPKRRSDRRASSAVLRRIEADLE